jgi:hypothetical protein
VTWLELNKSAGMVDSIVGLTSVTYGGVLVVGNQAGAYAIGDAFKLFAAASYSGAFARISPPAPGPGLVWDTGALTTDGTLRVISATSQRPPIAAMLAGHRLSLSWPAGNLGWRLQTQTNLPGVGLGPNWTTVPGSPSTNRMSFPASVDPSVGSVFFRLAASPSTATAQFGTGDLVVLQVGNGSIASTGAPGFLIDYLPFGGTSPYQLALPATGSSALIFGGSAYDGVLSLSADGHSIVVAGYNVPLGAVSGSIDSSSSTTVPRAVGTVNAAGLFTLNVDTSRFSATTFRSAAADGTGNFWAGGGSGGIAYLGTNSPATLAWNSSSATRDLAFVNGSLCFTETGSGQGVMSFSGAPTTSHTPTLVVNTAGTGTGTASPKGFAINPAYTIAYVADNRTAANGGGLQRFNWNGGWIYAYTLGYTLGAQEIYDLAVDFSGANPIIYAITGESSANHLVTITDTGTNSVYRILETAPAGDAFRGVAFAPN